MSRLKEMLAVDEPPQSYADFIWFGVNHLLLAVLLVLAAPLALAGWLSYRFLRKVS